MIQPKLITRDREILGGIPVFIGTRVPVKTLFDYLEHGLTRWTNFWMISPPLNANLLGPFWK